MARLSQPAEEPLLLVLLLLAELVGPAGSCAFFASNFELPSGLYDSAVAKRLRPRGPDAESLTVVHGWTIGFHLLHLTGERVLQPFTSSGPSGHANELALFNGEIYNYKALEEELRRELGPKAVPRFRSDGDVLLPAYRLLGKRFCARLEGEFAVVVVDFERGSAVFCTDPFRTKPLFFAIGHDGKRFGISSYESPLAEAGLTTDSASVVDTDANTFYVVAFGQDRGVELLERGPLVMWDLHQYKRSTEDWQKALELAISQRVQHSAQKESLALTLSGGQDSGLIHCVLGRLGAPHSTYSILGLDSEDVLRGRVMWNSFTLKSKLIRVSPDVYVSEANFLEKSIDNKTMFIGRSDGKKRIAEDDAAKGVSFIYRLARDDGHRVFLVGHGPDDHMTFYHRPHEFPLPEPLFSTGPSLDLKTSGSPGFPYRSFYGHSLRGALDREEFISGAFGIEARYPFLDRAVVQEWLWLHPELKNGYYKKPLLDHLSGPSCGRSGYPWVNEKLPFSVGTQASFFLPESHVEEVVGGSEGCWSGEISKEHCCYPARSPSQGPTAGNPSCWGGPFNFLLCCAERPGGLPRPGSSIQSDGLATDNASRAADHSIAMVASASHTRTPTHSGRHTSRNHCAYQLADANHRWTDQAIEIGKSMWSRADLWQQPPFLDLDTFMRYSVVGDAESREGFLLAFQRWEKLLLKGWWTSQEEDSSFLELLHNVSEQVPAAAAALGTMLLAKSWHLTALDDNDTKLRSQAKQWLEQGYRFGHIEAAHNLVKLLAMEGLESEAETVLQRVAASPQCKEHASTWNKLCEYKMQYDRRPALLMVAHKLHVKTYVRDRGVPAARLLAAARDPHRLPLANLSGCSFVVKTSHGSGQNIFVQGFRTPAQVIIEKGQAIGGVPELLKLLRFFIGRRYNADGEWAYFDFNNSLRTIIVEEYLPVTYHVDYKWYCYAGSCQMIQVNSPMPQEKDDLYVDFYTVAWERLNVTLAPHPPNPTTLPRPQLLSEMHEVAERLAADLDFVRVDLYELEGAVFFGELTLYPHGCAKAWTPAEFDEELRAAWPVDYGPCAHHWKRSRDIRPLNLGPFLGSPV